MASTFSIKQMQAVITLSADAKSTSFNEGGNTVTIGGADEAALRMSAHIQHAGGQFDSQMDLTIYGMTLSVMNQLSTLGMQINLIPKNQIILSAGDAESGLATAFSGFILAAYIDFQGSPEVAFRITAKASTPQGVIPATASSFPGTADVATIMSGLATLMGFKFENNGITTKLSNAYFSGSARAQMQACAKAAGINANVIDGTLAIWPKNGSRGGSMITLSPDAGLVGYPTYTQLGIMLRAVYNPSIGFGQKIKVEGSILPPANGTWGIYGLDHDLECQTINGKWESTILGYNPKQSPVAPVAP